MSDRSEIAGPALRGSVLIPFTRATVPTVDLDARVLVVDPPPGLIPGDERDA